MTYEQSLERLKDIVKQLESDDAISVDDYKKLALEAQQHLNFCRSQLTSIESDIQKIFEK